MTLLAITLTLAALPLLVACTYLLVLTLASRTSEAPPLATRVLKFAFVVPAHNESAGIEKTVHSLQQSNWPAELFGVVVVADNCTDDTAAKARQAGATVLERQSAELRGKGYALEHAFNHLLAESWADAAVIVDADTLISSNLLSAFAARLTAGARAAQADYAVQNPHDSWRTRLMTIALGMFHILRSRGRERLGVSCGLRGNGMCFALPLLREVPHQAFSLVEDLEYGVRLGEAGIRVHYAGEAHVYGEMVSGEKASRSQRRRWEDGRKQFSRERGPRLLARGLKERSGLLLDLAFDVLVPPLSTLAVATVAGLVASLVLVVVRAPAAGALSLFGLCAGCLGLYVARGWQCSGTGARGLLDLLSAPLYIGWKLVLALKGSDQRKGEWVRTTREGEPR